MKQHPCVRGHGPEILRICGIHMNSLGKSKREQTQTRRFQK